MFYVQNLAYTLQAYFGEPTYLILFFCSLMYIVLKADKITKKRMLWLIVFSVLFIYNDLSRMILEKLSEATYYRFLWMLPIIMLTAYVMVDVISKQKRVWGKVLIIFVACILASQGSNIWDGATLRLPENKYNVSDDVIQVSEIITEDKQIERPVVVFDLDMQLPIRTYDASIVWGIGRETYMNYHDYDDYNEAGSLREEIILIRAANLGIKGESEVLEEALNAKSVDYIVTYTSYEMDEYFEEVGYSLVGRSNTRSVYGSPRDNGQWTEETKGH